MDDGTSVSKYLLEPAFLRELYLFELATTIALMNQDVIEMNTAQRENERGHIGQNQDKMSINCQSYTKKKKRKELSKRQFSDDIE